MLKYIVKRILISIVILLGVSFLVYTLIWLMPGDYIEKKYAAQLAQGVITQQQVDEIKAINGVGLPLFQGYFGWLGNVFRGNLGDSLIYSTTLADGTATRNVLYVIKSKMGISFGISFVATVLEFLIAIPLGILSAKKQYSFTDYLVTVLVMMGISLPTFFLAALLMRLFSIELGWLPLQGLRDGTIITYTSFWHQLGDILRHLTLPMITLVILSIGGLMRYTRTNMLEVLNADYIRTARAKGLSEHTVIYKHAFRNTLIPLVTMFAGILPGLFGGALITETVFAIPGVGQMTYNAVVQGDIPLIMADTMFIAILSVIGVLLSDLMYALVDPRVKLS